MSRISLKYILNALFSKSEDDFEKKLDVNVAYDAPLKFDSDIIGTMDEIDSDIDETILKDFESVRTDKLDNKICDIEENNFPEEKLEQEKIDYQVEPLNNNIPNNASCESLLDNHTCMKMIECCLNNLSLIDEIDEATPISAVKEIIRQNYIETLLIIGATPIIEDKKFNAARHTPVSHVFIKPGQPIEIVIPGIEIDGKILIKAMVR